NVQTGAVPSLERHPLRFYYDYGIRVTINTDNRLMTDTSVTKELWLAHQKLRFTLEELKQIIIMGFKAAFLPLRDRRNILMSALDEIENLTKTPVQPEMIDREESGRSQPPKKSGSILRRA